MNPLVRLLCLAIRLLCLAGGLLGPVAAPMLRKQGRWRYQLWLQAPSRVPLHVALNLLTPWLRQHAGRVRWSLDVDPVEL